MKRRIVATLLLIVMLSFVLFNAEDLAQAVVDIGGLFGAGGVPLVSTPTLYYLKSYGVLFLLGVRGMYLALPVMILAMPLGLNLVVFPESMGIDASDNAKMCFVCNLLTIAVLPFVFALLSQIM